MKYPLLAGAFIIATISGAVAQTCAAGTATEINGNWYCSAVTAISYTNFEDSGSYDQITSMPANGDCTSAPADFSGPMAPMNGEVSWHFRGPLTLKQFAFYTPGSSSSKRDTKPSPHERRQGHAHAHGHKHFHARNKEVRQIQENHVVEARMAVTSRITKTMATTLSTTTSITNPIATSSTTTVPDTTTAAASSEAPSATASAGSGSWTRQAYFDADSSSADGLIFLNHMGGQGSGVFDEVYGASLSYSSPDGTTGIDSPQTLSSAMLDDNIEVVIMTDTMCNGDCGTTRPGGLAYHGFDGGSSKVFLMEFDMPYSGKTGFNMDMPAIWALNAQIPNTLQYGLAGCSCWTSGCGEWDIFEILDSGNSRAKSTYHGPVSGGDSNYFNRPANGTIKAAIVFDGVGSVGHIAVLPDDTGFSTTLADSIVASFSSQVAETFVLG